MKKEEFKIEIVVFNFEILFWVWWIFVGLVVILFVLVIIFRCRICRYLLFCFLRNSLEFGKIYYRFMKLFVFYGYVCELSEMLCYFSIRVDVELIMIEFL